MRLVWSGFIKSLPCFKSPTMKLLILFFCMLMTACSLPNQEVDPQILVETDIAFSIMSEAEGMKSAFLHYADQEVIKLQEKRFPIWGIEEMKSAFDKFDDHVFTITWEPLKAEIAGSGDLGYTMGNWKLVTAEGKVKYGNYVSIWKKQSNGDWKYVLDTGTDTPGLFKPKS